MRPSGPSEKPENGKRETGNDKETISGETELLSVSRFPFSVFRFPIPMIETSAAAPPAEAVADFAEDVRRDLALSPKQLQSKRDRPPGPRQDSSRFRLDGKMSKGPASLWPRGW